MSALQAAHEAAGASFVTVGGQPVPASYARGLYHEHDVVRTTAGIIDLSHLGHFEVTGPDRNAFINRVVCGDVGRLAAGDVILTALLTEGGGFLDEVMLYRFDEALLLVAHAENAAHAWLHLVEQKRRLGGNVRLRDVSEETAQVGLEGPRAEALVAPLADVDVAAMRFRTVRPARVAGIDVFLSRTGYSGEDGFELVARQRDVLALWQALAAAGAQPFGVLARDLLRLEMGYCAWGAELDADVTPAEAGLGSIVAFEKGARFIGEAALRAERRRGLTRCLAGVRTDPADAVVQAGDQVFARGRVVDRVRSAAFGPSAGGTVGLVYVPIAFAEPGTRLEAVGPAGTTATLVVSRRPFYGGGSRRRA